MKQKEIFIISLGIFLTIVFWLIVDVYHENAAKKLQLNIEPIQHIDSKINSEILNILKSKNP